MGPYFLIILWNISRFVHEFDLRNIVSKNSNDRIDNPITFIFFILSIFVDYFSFYPRIESFKCSIEVHMIMLVAGSNLLGGNVSILGIFPQNSQFLEFNEVIPK